ncbi:unnamed protein product, partial [Didymodactylos carnosus]
MCRQWWTAEMKAENMSHVQFLTGEALKWYLTQVEHITTWAAFKAAVRASYPPPPEPTRTGIFQQLLTRKQHHDEKFIQYYSDVRKLCHKGDPKLSSEQQLDLLQNGMKICLLDKISGLGVVTPEKLLEIVQLYEAEQQLIDSRTLQATSDSTTLALQSSIVDSLTSEFILGNDWRQTHTVHILDDRLTLRHHGLQTFVQFEPNVSVPVRLTSTTQLLPREENLVAVTLPTSSAATVYFKSNSQLQFNKNVMLSDGLLNVKNYKSALTVYNPSSFPRTLPTNTVLGNATFPDTRQSRFHPVTEVSSFLSAINTPVVLSQISTEPSVLSPTRHIRSQHNALLDK